MSEYIVRPARSADVMRGGRADRAGSKEEHMSDQVQAAVGGAQQAIHAPSAAFAAAAHVDAEGYARMYAASVADPVAFWAEQGLRIEPAGVAERKCRAQARPCP